MSRRIVLLGGPGAGKGTQAQRIAEKYGLAHISTGDIFRAHIADKTELGLKMESYLNKGKLAPDSLVCEIVSHRIREDDCAQGYVLDGFPRSVPQAEEFDRLLAERGESIDLAIILDVSDSEMVERLTSRRTCPECGRIYNLKSSPPARDNQCDEPGCDGAELMQREDDKEKTIRKRVKIYHETTEPIVEYYTKKGLQKTVRGENLSPDEITRNLEKILSTAGVS